MGVDDSILRTVRGSVVGDPDNGEFDGELILHINSAISKLNQNGVGELIFLTGDNETWSDLRDESQVVGNKHFQMIPLFITLSTKLLFDPPPPSSVEYYSKNAEELLWRLKIAHEGVE